MASPHAELKHRVIIAVGSNIDPVTSVAAARTSLTRDHHFIAHSPYRTTAPRGTINQPDFLNTVFEIETDMSLIQITDYLKNIENDLGRIRTADKNGPRTIDLDLCIFDDTIIDDTYNHYDFVRDGVEFLRTRKKPRNETL